MEERAAKLRSMKICRFCLTEKEPLSNIYERDNKNAIPLPLQVMACVTIEVFASDGMPQLICDDCQLQTRKSYSFKTMCKRSDDTLKLFLATGVLNIKEQKDEILMSPSKPQKRTAEPDPSASQEKRSKIDVSNKADKKDEKNKKEEIKVEKKDAELKEKETEVVEEKETEVVEEQETDEVEQVDDVSIQKLYEEPEVDKNVEENEESKTDPPEEQSKIETPPSKPKQVITHCFPCNYCERTFPLQQLLDIHMRQHVRERRFHCSECDKKFFTKQDLQKHHYTHSGVKQFECVVCKKSFTRATMLHRHEKIHRSVPKYLCNVCDKTFLSSDDFDFHMEQHKKNRPFKCTICNKSFAFKQGLERHELSHKDEMLRYKCNYCEQKFNTPAKLARHVQSHAGNRPYPCKLCPRTFLLSHHLTRHLRNHYTQKSQQHEPGEYKCDVCSMSFRRKDSLVSHTAIHSMVNLKCLICHKDFQNARMVKEHITTHLSGLQYPCDKCDYSFDSQEELEDHELRHVDYRDDEFVEEENTSIEEAPEESADADEETTPIRRSQRKSKVTNYADFLKDDDDEANSEEVEEEEEDEEQSDDEPIAPTPQKVQTNTIPPVIRSENVKTYKAVKQAKSKPDKETPSQSTPEPRTSTTTPKLINSLLENTDILNACKTTETKKKITKITTLENLGLTKQALDAMTDKSGFVEIKVDQKVIRVQKLSLSKAEYQAISKGQAENKGIVIPNLVNVKKIGQYIRKKPESITNLDTSVLKSQIRTYTKKVTKIKEEPKEIQESVETVQQNITENELNINCSQEETADTTIELNI